MNLHPSQYYMAKQKGIENGISKLWEQQVVRLGRHCPSAISEDYEEFVSHVDDICETYHVKKPKLKYLGITVCPPYTEDNFVITSFIQKTFQINCNKIQRMAYSFEVGELEGSENIHVHFMIETSGYPSKVVQYFKEHYFDYIRNGKSMVVKKFPIWTDDYLKKMYPTKQELHEKYGLQPIYTF